MGKKLTMLFLAIGMLSGLSGFYVVNGLQAYTNSQKGTVALAEHCGGQTPVRICVKAPDTLFSAFYPFDVATHNPLFAVAYSSNTPMTLVINVNIAGFTRSLTHTVNATSTVQTANFTPPLLPNVLRSLTIDDTTSLHVQVTDTNKRLYYLNDSSLLLRSRWLMQWVAANRLQIGAWVTPNDPAIGTLVTKAAARLGSEPPPIPTAMVGYNKASSKDVIAQVDAIYDALRLDYHMRYVQTSVPYAGPDSASVATENIKLPFEVLQQRSGMCIELTLLLASAVEHIGLHAEIVIVPGHAFLGVAVTPNNSHFEYWDAVEANNNVAGDSANIFTDATYQRDISQHSIVDTIVISDARNAGIQPMI
ncbi:MAG TPA: transglutaminase family protein [Ktedonobacteraceae bacterium]|nr:transglutaminase family protein [Ktedonobacteraceae bacterium]